jgi:hypothetical protein
MQYTLTDYLREINFGKRDLLRNGELDTSGYSKFLIFTCLGGLDTLLIVNEINNRPAIDNFMVNDYLLKVVPKKKNRFTPWLKKNHHPDIALIMKVYGYSKAKAIEAIKVLSPEQIEILKLKYQQPE